MNVTPFDCMSFSYKITFAPIVFLSRSIDAEENLIMFLHRSPE